MNLWNVLAPEMILTIAATLLFLLGIAKSAASRKLAPMLAIVALLIVVAWQLTRPSDEIQADATNALRVYQFADYIKLLAASIGVIFVLMAWPSDAAATGNSALQYGHEAGEFFALLLLSIVGIFMVAAANDLILLSLG